MVILVSSVKKIPELIQGLEQNGIDFIVEGTKNLFETEEIRVLCDSLSIMFDGISFQFGVVDKEAIKAKIIERGIPNVLVSRWKRYSSLDEEEIRACLMNFALKFCEIDDYEYTIQGNIRDLLSALNIFHVEDEKVLYNWGKFTEMVNDFETINLDMVPAYRLIAFKSFLEQDTPKNESSKRVIKVSPSVMVMLREWKQEQESYRSMYGDLWQETGFVFTNKLGKPFHPDSISSWFGRFVKENDLPPIHLHSLRHTNASLMIVNGVDMETVSKRLGHTDAQTTIKIYTHQIRTADAAAAEMLDTFVSGRIKKEATKE